MDILSESGISIQVSITLDLRPHSVYKARTLSKNNHLFSQLLTCVRMACWGLRLQLILQWSTGILVLICSFLEKTRFSAEIVAKLGSSFSLVPFIIVVVSGSVHIHPLNFFPYIQTNSDV